MVKSDPDISISPVALTIERTAAASTNTSTSANLPQGEERRIDSDTTPRLLAKVDERGHVRVLARVSGVGFRPEGGLSRAEARAQHAAIASGQDAVLSAIGRHATAVRRFDTIPFFAA